jgi:kinesin family protein 2/24
VRIPEQEFISRCQRTKGITPEHANHFYAKLWALHIDSRRLNAGKKENGETGVAKPTVPFQDRLRTGMFVRASKSQLQGAHETSRIVMLLCPEGALLSTARGAHKYPSRRGGKWGEGRYICAIVKAATAVEGAFEIDVHRQMIVTVADMEEELRIEYDSASRYYYITV